MRVTFERGAFLGCHRSALLAQRLQADRRDALQVMRLSRKEIALCVDMQPHQLGYTLAKQRPQRVGADLVMYADRTLSMRDVMQKTSYLKLLVVGRHLAERLGALQGVIEFGQPVAFAGNLCKPEQEGFDSAHVCENKSASLIGHGIPLVRTSCARSATRAMSTFVA